MPPGFTISTEVCTYYYDARPDVSAGLEKQVQAALRSVEKRSARRFGDPANPLLVSVRSGARASMPGMMDTILNLGLNDETVQGLIAQTGNERFAYDSYRRFVQMYGDVVLGLKPRVEDEDDPFEVALAAEEARARRRARHRARPPQDLRELVAEFKALIKSARACASPRIPQEQLWGAIGAVFGSWNNERAITYRKLNGIPESWGTAVNVQSMVFGNMGDDSGTGVAFTRDPSTGENVLLRRVPDERAGRGRRRRDAHAAADLELARENPKIYAQLMKVRRTLERHYRDMHGHRVHDPAGQLYMLQCRVGKRTAFAAVRIAVEMVEREAHHAEDGDPARRARAAQPAAASGVRRRGQDRGGRRRAPAREGAERRPGRRHAATSCSTPTTPKRWPRAASA